MQAYFELVPISCLTALWRAVVFLPCQGDLNSVHHLRTGPPGTHRAGRTSTSSAPCPPSTSLRATLILLKTRMSDSWPMRVSPSPNARQSALFFLLSFSGSRCYPPFPLPVIFDLDVRHIVDLSVPHSLQTFRYGADATLDTYAVQDFLKSPFSAPESLL